MTTIINSCTNSMEEHRKTDW